jgi:hypothetical protein
METNRKMKTTLIGLSLVCVAGCVSSAQISKIESSMPADWSVIPPPGMNTCASIDGDYQIPGLGKQREGAPLEEMRLDVALGHTFPSNKIPNRVNIVVDKGANMLNFKFDDPVNQVFSESISCSNGWYDFEQRLTDQYLGDGGYLDYLIRKVSLGKDSDGSLIVHLKLEGQSSTLAIFKSREAIESWSKYKVSE